MVSRPAVTISSICSTVRRLAAASSALVVPASARRSTAPPSRYGDDTFGLRRGSVSLGLRQLNPYG